MNSKFYTKKFIFYLLLFSILTFIIISCGEEERKTKNEYCTDDKSCINNLENKNHCNITTGKCVECFFDTNCQKWEICNKTSYSCELKSDSNCYDKDCKENESCNENHECIPNCIPKTCDDFLDTCGEIDNGCGNIINCDICNKNEICNNGNCELNCSSHDEKKCFKNSVYWYDSCGNQDELDIACAENEICNNAKCELNCTSHDEKKCFENSIYWYDSCGNQEELDIACAENEICNNGKCELNCSSHSEKKCFENNIFWYNSCGEKGELDTTCTDTKLCKDAECITPNDWFYIGDAPNAWSTDLIDNTLTVNIGDDDLTGDAYFYQNDDTADWYRLKINGSSNTNRILSTLINPANVNYKYTLDYYCENGETPTVGTSTYGTCQTINSFIECYASSLSNQNTIDIQFNCENSNSAFIYIIIDNQNTHSEDKYHISFSFNQI